MSTGGVLPDDPPAEPCLRCADGRMGAWATVRGGPEPLSLGELVLVGRSCDRCRHVELKARRQAPEHPPARARRGRPSPGGELLDAVLKNLRAALGEVWKAGAGRRRGPGRPR